MLQRHALGGRRNEHERQVLVSLARLASADERIDVVGDLGARAPALVAVDDHLVAPALGAGRDAGEIRAHIRLRQPVGEQEFAVGETRQEALLLLLAAGGEDVHAAVARIHEVERADHHGSARQLLDRHHGGEHIAADAAVFLRHRHAADAEIANLVHQRARNAVLFVPLRHLLAGRMSFEHAADAVAQHRDMFGLAKIHVCPPVELSPARPWSGADQAPVNLGLRFSLKALMASRWSSCAIGQGLIRHAGVHHRMGELLETDIDGGLGPTDGFHRASADLLREGIDPRVEFRRRHRVIDEAHRGCVLGGDQVARSAISLARA